MQPWQTAFAGVSLLLGEPPEAVSAALGDEVSHALLAMTSGSREDRARALARAVSEVAVAIDAARFA
jgi:hypothetical protein